MDEPPNDPSERDAHRMTPSGCLVCGGPLSVGSRLDIQLDVPGRLPTPAIIHLHRRCAASLTSALLQFFNSGEAPRPAHRPKPGQSLSPRERQVLTYLVEGKTNAEIARILGVRFGTVRSQVTSLMIKLGVSSRTEAAVVAVRRGLLREP
jgi:DNA-binding CsgD family transcriptional regulator